MAAGTVAVGVAQAGTVAAGAEAGTVAGAAEVGTAGVEVGTEAGVGAVDGGRAGALLGDQDGGEQAGAGPDQDLWPPQAFTEDVSFGAWFPARGARAGFWLIDVGEAQRPTQKV